MRIQLLNVSGAVDSAKIEIRVRRAVKELNLGNSLVDKGSIDRLIVIGDGTPDDIVVTVISYLLDGICNAGLLIPTDKGFGAVRHVVQVMRTFSGKPIAFVLDQEDLELEDFYKGLSNKFLEFGVTLEPRGGEGRWREFLARFGSGSSRIIVVVNGLEGYEVHKIEDHLLALLGVDLKRLPANVRRDSKEAWKLLSSKEENLLITALKKLDRGNLSEYFPQHAVLEKICSN